MEVEWLIIKGDLFVNAHELACSVRKVNCDQKPVPKHRTVWTPKYLLQEVDAIPHNLMLYHPEEKMSRANFEKIEKKCNEDIFGNPSTKAAVIPLAYLYSHLFHC